MTSASTPPEGGAAPGDALDPRDLLLAPALAPGAAERALAARGFRRPREADATIARLARDVEERRALAEVLPALLDELHRAGSSDRGLANVARLFDATPSRLALAARLAREPSLLARAAVLLSQSQHFADILAREPYLLDWLGEQVEAPTRERLIAEFAAETTALREEAHRVDAVRRLHRRELLACGYRDLVLGRPLDETVASLSRLAEAVVDACLGLAEARLRARLPALPPGPLPFAVVALGKLGGGELNYSSDIDLVFVHDEGFAAGDLSTREVMSRLGKELVGLLSASEGGQPLYRVDMRLRPEGAQGALSRGIAAYVRYYESYGRTWERQALLKARPIAGDLACGARLVEAIAPFVYRRSLDVPAIGEIKALKRQIEARGAARPTRDVKEAPGGIRDVEFAVQFLLLLHGGELPEVRDPSTLGAIARLERAECLAAGDARALREAYVFLRTVEHRLQVLHALQTHELPADPEEVRDLARRLGLRGEDPAREMHAALERHGRAAQEVLDRVLHGLFPEPAGAAAGDARAAELLLDPDPSPEKVAGTLAAFGVRDPAHAMAAIRRLATESSRLLAGSPRTRTALASLLPALLRRASREEDPDETLLRFERAAATLGGKAGFYQLLAARPETLALFVRTAGESRFLSDLLARSPGALDEVVDLLLTDEPVTTARVLERIAAARAAGVADPEAAAHRSTTLLVGLRDVGGTWNVTNVQEALTALADAVLLAALPEGAALAILALGKLGGRELGYGSDLDLIPAYEGESEPAQRAARALVRRVEEQSLYGVDLRLRPDGSKGPLAASFGALADYYASERACTWERLAATKLRLVAGGREDAARLARVLDAVYAARPPGTILREAREMRLRLEETATGPLDLKRAPGGLLDIEFIVACARLLAEGRPAEVREPGVVPALHALARAGRIERAAYVELLTGYQLLRKVEAKLRIAEGRPVSSVPDDERARAALARRLGYVDTPRRSAARAFIDELRYTLARVRARFDAAIPPLTR